VTIFSKALVHVSTAYSNCNRQEVSELVYPPPADPEKIMQCAEWLEDDLLETITPKQVVPVLTVPVEDSMS
jgi:fatty acyl-CoA reductase